MNLPKVFIIILNWNGLEDTLECLESVFKMAYPNFKVIVVDNGSTDKSVVVIQENYPEVIMIENKANLGYTGGNNVAMGYAMQNGADYMWLLNNDTIVESDTLNKLIAIGESNAEIGLLSPVIYYCDVKTEIQFCGDYIDWENHSIHRIRDIELWRNKDIKRNLLLWGTALLIKGFVIEQVGYLKEEYFAYCEDAEYCVRVSKSGYAIALVPRAKVYHKDSRSGGDKRAPLKVYLRTRNIYLFWMSNLKGVEKLKYFIQFVAHVISYSGALREMGLNNSADACFNGAWAALRGRVEAWDENIKAPFMLKKIFSWHPYFWTNLFEANFRYIIAEMFRKARNSLGIV